MNIENKKFPFLAYIPFISGGAILKFISKNKNNNYKLGIRVINSSVQFKFESWDFYSQASLENDMKEIKDMTTQEKFTFFEYIF